MQLRWLAFDGESKFLSEKPEAQVTPYVHLVT